MGADKLESGAGGSTDPQATAEAAALDRIVMPVIHEQAHLEKRVVETGALRVRKVVAEHDETLETTLAREEFDVERIALDRVIDAPIGVRQEGDVTIVPVIEERVVVQRQLVLKEEIRITRRRNVENAPQTVKLRREEVIVERRQAGSDQWYPVEVAISSPSTNVGVASTGVPAGKPPVR